MYPVSSPVLLRYLSFQKSFHLFFFIQRNVGVINLATLYVCDDAVWKKINMGVIGYFSLTDGI